jgi:CheY-like chemotaxis protein
MDGSCDRIVFVVDDDTDIREALAELLHEEGFSVVTASDGRDALEKLKRTPGIPCVILLDLMMPVMTGPQLYAELKADPQLAPIPVVVVSADGDVRKKAAALSGEYLAKPLRFDTVLDVVNRHCA